MKIFPPRWYPMSTDALPKWVPQRYVPSPHRYAGERVEPVVRVWDRIGRDPLWVQSYRLLGASWNRDGFIYIRAGWYWYARLELFLQACLNYAIVCAIRLGLLRGPYEGCFFHEMRFDPPDLWGSPIRKGDFYVGKPPQYYDRHVATTDSGRKLYWRERNW